MKHILRAWLAHQCQALSGAKHALLQCVVPNEGLSDQLIRWPDETHEIAALSRVAQAALHLRQPVIKTRIQEVEPAGEPVDALACPLVLSERLFGVLAIEISHRSQALHQEMVRRIQTGAMWLETMIQLHGSSVRDQLVHLVELVAAAMEHERFDTAALDVANELAQRLSCQQVSLGFLSGRQIRLAAISHTARVEEGSNLVRAIREAMCEALDQAATIVYPEIPGRAPLANRFHAQLALLQQAVSICTVPLVKNGKPVGAMLLQRGLDRPFTAEIVEQCEQIGVLLGPILETRRSEERPLALKIIAALRDWLGRIFGARHLTLKAALTLILLLSFWFSMAEGTFRVTSDAVLEAAVCRAAVAPQQGFIAAAHVRAGDLVSAGDLLASLDDRELQLEQRKWQSQRAQLMDEYRKALARADRAEIAILEAKRLQAEAQLNLVKQQLQRVALVAPFSGLVVKGDLSQSLGSPVERGEVLFEIAPTNQYRVAMKVDESDIGHLRPGQQGRLKLSSLPEHSVEIVVDRLTPVSTGTGGRNYFRVEAQLKKQSDLMRPGMEGIAKIDVGREKLLWIGSRRLVDWGRLFSWSRLP